MQKKRLTRLTGALLAAVFIAVLGRSLVAQTQTVTCANGFDVGLPAVPPILLTSLKTVPNPMFPRDPVTFLPALRPDLAQYVADPTAAIQLGKALFWDMQAGSDGKTACATCHHHAGVDARTRNQLNPGANGAWDAGPAAAYGPNQSLQQADFPFTDNSNNKDVDNIAGSQGVRKSAFGAIDRKGVESATAVADPVFSAGGKNVRQVTGMQAPTVIDSIFNHRNFFNGRAQPEFNGVNPWGNRDAASMVWMAGAKGTPVQTLVRIVNASSASQAVGPALNPVEMSAAGRTFPDLGRKMLLVKPLGTQKVDAGDSVLGPLADTATGKGLTVSYKTLVERAFQPKWWNANKSVTVNGKTYSMEEANFSLYWGLAIMLYESSLVSDDTPIDQYLAVVGTTRPGPSHASAAILNDVASRLANDYGYVGGVAGILNGLSLFEQPLPPAPVGTVTGLECTACHLGANLTSASVKNLVNGGVEAGDAAFKLAGFDLRMERMFMQLPAVPTDVLNQMQNPPLLPRFFTDQIKFDLATYGVTVNRIQGTIPSPPYDSFTVPGRTRVVVYDAGWYNVGVRPAADDAGLGGADPWGKALSWTRLFQTTLADPSLVKVPGGGGLGCVGFGNATFPAEVLNAAGFPLLSGPLLKCQPGGPCDDNDVGATFKTASLRNVELTGPYFHNGGKATLRQVVSFYDTGGDFQGDTQSPLVKFYGFMARNGVGPTAAQQTDIVAFLLALTDERVRWERAPFDHPQLFVPNGDSPAGTDSVVEVPAVGAPGAGLPVGRFLGLNPFQQ